MEIKGVDLSFYQAGIDYNALKAAGVEFAVIRAGFSQTEDSCFKEHVNGCIAAGIDYGFYWFSYARDPEDIREEAAACLRTIGVFPAPKYPVFFDCEDNSVAGSVGKTMMTDMALAFVEEVERGGYPCGIYTNPDWLESKYDKSRIVGKTDVWLAHWTFDPEVGSKYDYGQTIWQWGITRYGGVETDADICFVDYPALTDGWYADHGVSEPKTIEQLAAEVIDGLWGAGSDRKQRLTAAGYDYNAVQSEVNRQLYGEQAVPEKTISEVAMEVVRGLWGVGEERERRLTAAGYDYDEVQAEVNRLVK